MRVLKLTGKKFPVVINLLKVIDEWQGKGNLYILFTMVILGGLISNINAQEISKSFELRYFASDEKADGETDFKGETEYFNTEQRIEYLEKYEEYAGQFFNNPDWNKLVVTDDEAKEKAAKIKPQPTPKIRSR